MMVAMVEPITIGLFIIAILVAAVMFCLWLAVTLLRFFRNVFLAGWRRAFGSVRARSPVVMCASSRCGATNPPQARFCRRCGQPINGMMRVVSSGAA